MNPQVPQEPAETEGVRAVPALSARKQMDANMNRIAPMLHRREADIQAKMAQIIRTGAAEMVERHFGFAMAFVDESTIRRVAVLMIRKGV